MVAVADDLPFVRKRRRSLSGLIGALIMAMGLLILRSSGSADPPPEEVSSECDGNSNLHYIRDTSGEYGAENGTDWDNAYDGIPSTLQRGHSYYLADGSYGSYLVDDATSGTTQIYLCKASANDHGTDTGWSSTMGDGQAAFTKIDLTSSYITVDGAYGDGSTSAEGMSDPTTYGIKVNVPAGADSKGVEFDGAHLTAKHIAVQCHGATGDFEDFGFGDGPGDFSTVSYAWTDDCQISVKVTGGGDDVTVEHSYFGPHWSSAGHHGVQVMVQNNPIVRFNYFDFCDPQCIEPAGGQTDDMVGGQFYGNVAVDIAQTNGFLKGVANSAIIDTVMYNNTLVNSDGPLLIQNNGRAGVDHSSSGNVLYNNLVYNASGLFETGLGSAPTHDYNYSINSGDFGEANDQSGSSDPFVDLAGGDFHLTGHTNPGKTDLGSPYNVDLDGNTRTTWDRGAYEYVP